ncbi:MAG: transposase [Oscillospiraceae bacterium]|nr:transposase [Oscillospiraceae bacterium]
MDTPKRKPNRLPNFDYSAPGAYFITICTKDKRNLFWTNVGASIARPQLTRWGEIAANAICNISKHYPAISVDRYVVMPNHIHLLLQINTDENGRPMVAPTISVVIQQLKGIITKQVGQSVWQKLFHDHIIRSEADYFKIWEYIENNPAKWEDDCFYKDFE